MSTAGHHRLGADREPPRRMIACVPAVHAVEDADRDDAVAPAGRDRVQSMPSLHSRPYGPIRPAAKTSTGRAGSPSSRSSATHGPSGSIAACTPSTPPRVSGRPKDSSRRLVGVMSRTGKAARSAVGQRHRDRIVQRGELVEGVRPLERERPDAGAPQRGEVPADAERGAEIAGQRPDVGAGRALDGDVDVEQVRRGPGGVQRGSNARTVTGRAASSTCSPARTRLYARLPSTLIAETALGTCSMLAGEMPPSRASTAAGVDGRRPTPPR